MQVPVAYLGGGGGVMLVDGMLVEVVASMALKVLVKVDGPGIAVRGLLGNGCAIMALSGGVALGSVEGFGQSKVQSS